MNFEYTLNELYKLTQKEELTADETVLYIQYVDTLKENNIEIPFAIEY